MKRRRRNNNQKVEEETDLKKKKSDYDEEITSDEEEEEIFVDFNSDEEEEIKEAEDSEEQDEETLDEKRIKKAKEYLNKISKIVELEKKDDSEDETQDPILLKLKMESQKRSKSVPSDYTETLRDMTISQKNFKFIKGHHKSVTSIALDEDNGCVFTGSKDFCLMKWDLQSGKKQVFGKYEHKGHILAMTLSSDGNFLVSGSRDKTIKIWNPKTLELIETLKGHTGDVTSLSFQLGTHQLYSASLDRTIKVWDLDEMAYVESLYGHLGPVNCVDSMYQETALTCGDDCTMRFWKIVDETQLIFKGHEYSIDNAKLLKENEFISGGQDGDISFWTRDKKKPVNTFDKAHGGLWISSIAGLRFSNVGASGSSDGYLKIWKFGQDSIELLNQIPINGFVNAIEFSKNGEYIVAAIGQEHKLGRWDSIKSAKNGLLIYKLK